MLDSLRDHWPEYAIEAACLGAFMISANLFAALIFHPGFPVAHAVADPLARRVLMGLAMGATAVAIILSPWGRRSGAHMNPATTLTFFRLGKVKAWDAVFYVVFQFAGGIAGSLAAAAILGNAIGHPAVDWVVTTPGPWGRTAAFVAEIGITYVLMLTVLNVTNTKRLARHTAFFVGALVAIYIALESPVSGMSMNPARTFGSALGASNFTALWIYFTAPPLAMLLAAETFVRTGRARVVHCAKYHHENDHRCIFNCRYGELR
jgi:aquaporin Z